MFSSVIIRAEFPDPPSYNQQRQQHNNNRDEHERYDVFDGPDVRSRGGAITGSQLVSRDLRSQSEYKMSSNPKVGLGQRAQSSPDETELYSEITVCMSQV